MMLKNALPDQSPSPYTDGCQMCFIMKFMCCSDRLIQRPYFFATQSSTAPVAAKSQHVPRAPWSLGQVAKNLSGQFLLSQRPFAVCVHAAPPERSVPSPAPSSRLQFDL